MSQLDEITAVKVFGEECSLKEVLQLLNMRDGLRPAAEGIVARRIFRKKAEELGLTVSDEELQKEADDQRTAMQLHKAEDAKAWLAARNMTLEDYETLLEDGLLTKKVKDVISEGRIESYFSEKRHEFDRAVLSQIVVADQAVAEELATQLQDEEAEWDELVLRSVHEQSKEHGGSVGLVARMVLSPSVQAAVFTANAGDVVGPVKTDMGYHVIRIDELLLGELNEQTRVQIREHICEEWLQEQIQTAGVELLLHEAIA